MLSSENALLSKLGQFVGQYLRRGGAEMRRYIVGDSFFMFCSTINTDSRAVREFYVRTSADPDGGDIDTHIDSIVAKLGHCPFTDGLLQWQQY